MIYDEKPRASDQVKRHIINQNKTYIQYVLSVVLFLMIAQIGSAQSDIQFHDLSEGLSHGTITAFAQDKQGYLWVGTEYGLNRFDGLSYRYFDLQLGDTDVANAMKTLWYDGNSNSLWIGSYGGGVAKLNLDNFEFADMSALNLSLRDNHVRDLYLGADSVLWIATEKGGLSLMDLRTEEQIYSIGSFGLNQLSERYVTDLSGFGNYILLATWSSGVIVLNTETGIVKNFYDDGTPVRSIIPGGEGCFFIGTNKGLKVLSLTDEVCFQDEDLIERLSDEVVLSLLQDRQGRLLVGTENEGLFIYDKGEFRQYVSSTDYDNQISGNSIWRLFEDRAGIIWIGLHQRGLNKIDPLEGRFERIQKFKCGDQSIELDQVNSLLETEERIWIGTDGKGLYSIDKMTGQYHCHEFAGAEAKAITALDEDENGILWVGTWNDGVIQYNYKNEISTILKAKLTADGEIYGDFVHAIGEDNRGNIWVSYFGKKIEIYNNYKLVGRLERKDLSSTRVTTYLKGCGDDMIIGTEESGVQILTMNEDNTIARSRTYLNIDSAKIAYDISDLAVDKDCGIWVATTKGLFHIDESNGQVTNHSASGAMKSQFIASVKIVGDTAVWGSTNKGVFCLNLLTSEVENYDTYDGLLSNQNLKGSSMFTSDNTLYFGNNLGVNYFNTSNKKYNEEVPEVYITDIFVSGEALKPPFNNSSTAKNDFTHLQNDLTFNYTALNFTQAKQNQFKIKLIGLEDDWRDVASKREIEYQNLSPGKYTFEVKGSNNDGIWNESPQQFSFTILQPWYNRWWAWLAYALLFFGIAYVLVKITLARLKLESELKFEQLEYEKLKELDKVKSRFVANVSHELLTPLTMIISPLKGEKQARVDGKSKGLGTSIIQMMLDNAESLKKHINQMLNLSKLESGSVKLEVREHDFLKFIRMLIENFKILGRDKDISIHLVDINVRNASLYYDEERMEQILTNLLSNAVKYSDAGGVIIISISEQENEIVLQVKDNGRGIKKENLSKIFDRYFRESEFEEVYGTGIGLNIVQQLVHLHKAEIFVDSKLGEFTTFTLNIKKGYAHFAADELLSSTDQMILPEQNAVDVLERVVGRPEEEKKDLPLILLAEDNQDIATYLISYLEADYNFMWAKDGQSGIEMAQEHLPDVIISDVMMPRKNGFELCEAVKSNVLTSHISIIMLTVKSSTQNQIEGYKYGADYYMTKPFNPELIKLRLVNILNQKRNLAAKLSMLTVAETQEVPEEIVGLSDIDKEFLSRVERVVFDHLSDSKFSVVDLSKELGYSKSQLYRKLKAVLDQSPNELIRKIRLEEAAKMIANSSFNISEITYKVGFNDLKYFRSCFKKQFGVNPSTYKTVQKSEIDN